MATVFSILQSPEEYIYNSSLLKTKLYIPKLRNNLLMRRRLVDKLDQLLACALTVVSAPAGSGKTTLLSSWGANFRQNGVPVAWVSLDEQDDDEIRFWSYLTAALENVQTGVSKNLLSLLQAPQPPSIDAIVNLFINASEMIKSDFALILDDFHLIKNQNINNSVSYLLERKSEKLHLIIGSRTLPNINLARLRAHRELLELSLEDLRFDFSESVALLNHIEGLGLSEDIANALTDITEGWVTGLQLAAISLHANNDRESFLQSFRGGHQHVLKYLFEEVFARLPKAVQHFLLETSVLERFTCSLCERLTGIEDTAAAIEYLQRTNLFIISLDDNNFWYRYHHLFRDFLLTQLRYQKPKLVIELHCKASEWFADNGLTEEAINHSLAAKDFTAAAKLLEQISRTLLKQGKIAMLLDWLKQIPEDVIDRHPELCVAQAWALASMAKFHGVVQAVDRAKLSLAESRLQIAINLLQNGGSSNAEALGEAFAVYTAIATGQQQIEVVIEYSKKALALLPEQNFLYGVVVFSLGIIYWVDGKLEEAKEQMAKARSICYTSGNIYTALFALACYGDLERYQGHLKKPFETYTILSSMMEDLGLVILPVMAKVHIGLGWITYEWNSLDDALKHMKKAIEIGQQLKDRDILLQSHLGLITVLSAQGEFSLAFDTYEKSKEMVIKYNLEAAVPIIKGTKARLSLITGEYDEFEQWIIDSGLKCDGEFDSWRTFDYFMVAHALILQDKNEEALSLIEHALKDAQKSNHAGNIKWILLLKALALYGKGELQAALVNVSQALKIAEPDGNIMLVIQYGKPMASLLLEFLDAKKTGRHKELADVSQKYVENLLVSFHSLTESSKSITAHADAFTPLEPLSEREIDVLKLLAKGMMNKEIAAQLLVAINTVKTHIKNIYAKLEVKNRIQAIERARQIGIL